MVLLCIFKTSKYVKSIIIQNRNLYLLNNIKDFIEKRCSSTQKKASFPVLDPADDSVIIEVPDMESVDAKNAIEIAANTFQDWRNVPAKERSNILTKWFDICEQNTDYLAEIITAESGKPLYEAKHEVKYGNSYLQWFAGCARHLNGETVPSPWPNKLIMTTRHPLGVVSVITPWNFPYAMLARKVSALMAAGCTCVIKPSEDTPLTTLAAVELANKAGVPKGIINVITCSRKNAPSVGSVLCQDDNVQCISFTGSNQIGKILYGLASKGVKKVTLELGGNAPFIVLPSANIKRALDHALIAKFRNNGQTCVGANRFLVHTDVYEDFVCGFKNLIQEKCILGPGTKQGVTCGPLINMLQAQKISSLVSDAVKKGACLLTGGEFAKELGTKFYKSTLLVNVRPDMQIFNEEIFGPVVQVLKVNSEEEALKMANLTRTGLACYLFTQDLGQAFRMSTKLEFGMVAINDGILSTAEAAFGGIGEAGIGREGSLHGAEEYTDLKYTLISGLDK